MQFNGFFPCVRSLSSYVSYFCKALIFSWRQFNRKGCKVCLFCMVILSLFGGFILVQGKIVSLQVWNFLCAWRETKNITLIFSKHYSTNEEHQYFYIFYLKFQEWFNYKTFMAFSLKFFVQSHLPWNLLKWFPSFHSYLLQCWFSFCQVSLSLSKYNIYILKSIWSQFFITYQKKKKLSFWSRNWW